MRLLAGPGLVFLTACGTASPDGGPTTGVTSLTTVSGPGTDATTNPTSATGSGEGATATSIDSSGSAEATTDPPKFDLAAIPDTEPMACIQCGLTIASMQSGVFTVEGANVFATATLEDQVVYALGTAGTGRFIATADSSLPFNEVSDCPLVPWLAGSEATNAPLLWFGWTPSDGPMQWAYPGTAAGVHLPAQYIGNPAQLAADYDIVMYLEASGQFDMGDQPSDAEMQTLVDYATLHGGGLYVSSEFADPAGGVEVGATDLASVNRLLQPLGLTALQVSLNWGNVDGNIDFECFPPPAG
jgi:hypothetical protein